MNGRNSEVRTSQQNKNVPELCLSLKSTYLKANKIQGLSW